MIYYRYRFCVIFFISKHFDYQPGIFFHAMEITPHAVGVARWNGKNELVSNF